MARNLKSETAKPSALGKTNGFAFVPGTHQVEPAQRLVPLPARTLSPTRKAYPRAATIKAAKPSRFSHKL